MKTDRHAYLILAHNCPRLLQVLIDMIDDERNDIYIHVDAKADMSQFSDIHATKSRITYTERVKIYYANISFVEAEYILLETAKKNGPYLYYHLLSGIDLPLKTQNYIHHLFDEVLRGKEFVGYSPAEPVNYRVRYYYFFDRYFRGSPRVVKLLDIIRNKLISLQKKMRIWRHENVKFYKGAAWFSITEDLLEYLLTQKKLVMKLYWMTVWPDESFIQTLIINTPFYDKLYDKDDENKGCLRLIDWDRRPISSSPYVWKREDWKLLTSNDRIFARKFSEDDMDFIYKLRDYVLTSDNG